MKPHRTWNGRSGQSLVETCLTILLVGLIFAGIVQVSRVLAAHEILRYAACCGARAKTVGFNRWMVEKCIAAGAIANAGRMTSPAYDDQTPLRGMIAKYRPGQVWSMTLGLPTPSGQFAIERGRIPEYLDSDNPLRSQNVLQYEDWDTIQSSVDPNAGAIGLRPGIDTSLRVLTEQEYPLRFPAHRIFFGADTLSMKDDSGGKYEMENHYPLYLDDRHW